MAEEEVTAEARHDYHYDYDDYCDYCDDYYHYDYDFYYYYYCYTRHRPRYSVSKWTHGMSQASTSSGRSRRTWRSNGTTTRWT